MQTPEIERLYLSIQRYRGVSCIRCRSTDTFPLSTGLVEPLLNICCDNCGHVESRRLTSST